MPTISHFHGITIVMYWDEPRHHTPHFHALYGEQEASLALTGQLLASHLPRRQLRLVQVWCALRAEDLHANWLRADEGQPMEPIAPLSYD